MTTQTLSDKVIRNLTPNALKLWETLTAWAGEAGEVSSKLSALAGPLHVSEKTVSRATKELVAVGIVRTTFTQGTVKTWTLLHRCPQMAKAG